MTAALRWGSSETGPTGKTPDNTGPKNSPPAIFPENSDEQHFLEPSYRAGLSIRTLIGGGVAFPATALAAPTAPQQGVTHPGPQNDDYDPDLQDSDKHMTPGTLGSGGHTGTGVHGKGGDVDPGHEVDLDW
ncbi:hypothetical protein [Streptomyces sp. NPDC048269]|uniref:hypothetical protein n=1 Tax=Streptomyces sp. NPDC048269 TaxID=3155753 RepID=UPI003432AEFC